MKFINSIFAACITVIGFTVFANPLPDGKNYTEKVGDYIWTFSVENGEATIVHLGMDGYGSYWEDGQRAVEPQPQGALEMPATLGGCPVIGLGYRAVADCDSMTAVTMSDAVKNIGNSAFSSCNALRDVNLSSGVTNIGYEAFWNCPFSAIDLPSGLVSIGGSSFSSCNNLEQVLIPASTRSIGEGAFRYCSQLRNLVVDVDNPNYTSDDGVLYDKSKETIYFWPQTKAIGIPEGVRNIGPSAFANNYQSEVGLVSLTLPSSVTNVGSYAFQSCNLREVKLNEGLVSIAYGAFQGNYELRSIVIPSTVRGMESDLFSSCSRLASVFFAGSAPEFVSNYLYDGAPENLTTFVRVGSTGWKTAGSAELPAEWPARDQWGNGSPRAIREWTTYPAIGWMVRFDLGEGAVRTGGGELEQMVRDGHAAVAPELAVKTGYQFVRWNQPFDCVSNAMTIATIYKKNGKLLDGKNYTEKVGGYTWTFSVENGEATIVHLRQNYDGSYYEDGQRAVEPQPQGALQIPATLGGCPVVGLGYEAINNGGMTSVILPGSIRNVGRYALAYCYSLKDISMGNAVTNIGSGAFENCLFSAIDLPSGLVSVGESAFWNCYNLEQILIPAFVRTIGEGAFRYCSQLRNLVVDADNPNYTSDDGVLYDKNKETIFFWPQRKAIEIPGGVRNIGPSAFANNYQSEVGLVSLTLPSSVTNIGQYAFQSCNLREVKLNEGLESIGYGAFQGNYELRSIVIPSTVRGMESDLFSSCSRLMSVFFAGNAPEFVSNYLYNGAPANLTTFVRVGSTGWKTAGSAELPAEWPARDQWGNGSPRAIREWTTYPAIGWVVCFDIGEGAIRTGGGEREQMVQDGHPAIAPALAVKTGYQFVRWDQPFDCVSNAMTIAAIYKKNGKLLDGKNYTEKVGDYTWTFSVENGEATIVHLGQNYDGSYYEDGQRAVEPQPQGALEIPATLGGCPVVGLGYRAIYDGGMTSVILPDSIRNVGRYALAYCYSLKDISMGNAVTNIGESAFVNCYDLEQVLIPASVQSIGEGAFRYCSQLRNLTVDAGNPYYKSDDGVLYDKGGETIFFWPRQKPIEIPEGVRDIRSYVFDNNYASQNGTVALPSTVTNIGQYAFQSCYLRGVDLNEGLISIGYGAFQGNYNLKSIVIPSTVRKIDGYVFGGCSRLLSVFFDGNAPDEVSNYLYGNTSEELITLVRPGSMGWNTAGGSELPEVWPGPDQWGNVGEPRPIREWKDYPTVGWLVQFDLGEGADRTGGGALEQIVEDGKSAIAPALALKPGYEFVEWDRDFSKVTTPMKVRARYLKDGKRTDGEGYAEMTNGCTWIYSIVDGVAIVTGVSSKQPRILKIPGALGGCPVKAIGDNVGLSSKAVIVPATVQCIGAYAFGGTKGQSIWYEGDCPEASASAYGNVYGGCSYVQVGAQGWNLSAGEWLGQPIKPWTTYDEIGWDVTFDLGDYGERTGGGELNQFVIDGKGAVAPICEGKTGYEFVGWDRDFSAVTGRLSVRALYTKDGNPVGWITFNGTDYIYLEDYEGDWTYVDGVLASRAVECWDSIDFWADSTKRGCLTFEYRCVDTNGSPVRSSLNENLCSDEVPFRIIAYDSDAASMNWNAATIGVNMDYLEICFENLSSSDCHVMLRNFKWENPPEYVTITLDPELGKLPDGQPSELKLRTDGTYGELPIPEREGCEFLYWTTSEWDWWGEGSEVDSETPVPLEDTTLFAVWDVPPEMIIDPKESFESLECDWYDYGRSYDEQGYLDESNLVYVVTNRVWHEYLISESELAPDASNVFLAATFSGAGRVDFGYLSGSMDRLVCLVDGKRQDLVVRLKDESNPYMGYAYSVKVLTGGEHTLELVATAAPEAYWSQCYYYSIGEMVWSNAEAQVTVAFDPMGGTANRTTQTYLTGSTYGSFPSIASRPGFTFLGWFTDPAGGEQKVESDLVDFETTTLYARWKTDLGTALNNKELQFASTGVTGWDGLSGITHDGIAAAATGWLEWNETNVLSTTVNGRGVLNFWWRTEDASLTAQDVDVDLTLEVDGRDICLHSYGYPATNDNVWLRFSLSLTNDCAHTIRWKAALDSTGRNKMVEFCEKAGVEFENLSIREMFDLNAGLPFGTISVPGAWVDEVEWRPGADQTDVVQWGHSAYQARRNLPGKSDPMLNWCNQRIAANPNDYDARVRRAITRLKALSENPVFRKVLAQYGLSFCDDLMTLVGTLNADNAQSSNETVDMVAAETMPILGEILDDLDVIPEGWDGTVALPASQYPVDEDIYIDYADVVMAKSCVHGAKAAILAAQGYDLILDNQKMCAELIAASNKKSIVVSEFTGNWSNCQLSRMKGFGDDGWVRVASSGKKLLMHLTLPELLPEDCDRAENLELTFALTRVTAVPDAHSFGRGETLDFTLDLMAEQMKVSGYGFGYDGLEIWSEYLLDVEVVRHDDGLCVELEFDLSALKEVDDLVGFELDRVSLWWTAHEDVEAYGTWLAVPEDIFYIVSDGCEYNPDLTIESILGAHPQCAAVIRDQASLTASKSEVRTALELYGVFDAALRARTSGKMHFFEYDSQYADQWQAVLDSTKQALVALDDVVTVKGEDYACFEHFKETNLNERVTLKPFFDGKILRSLLPPFEGDRPVLSSIPDITFAGTFPDWTMENRMPWLRKIDGVWYGVPPEPPVDPNPPVVEPVVTNTITYVGLEGAVNTNATTFTTNDLPLVLGPVEREGYVFLGWTPWNGVIPLGTTSNVTFTATWEVENGNPDAPGVIVDPAPTEAERAPLAAEDVMAAQTYNGYLTNIAAEVVGSVTVKVAKRGKVTATVQLPDGSGSKALKKFSYEGTLDAPGHADLTCRKNRGMMSLFIGKAVIAGTVTQGGETYGITCRLGSKDVLKTVDLPSGKVWTVALHTPTNGVPHPLMRGYSCLTVTTAKQGKVKVSGLLADGTKVSVTAQGMVFGSKCIVVPAGVALYKGKVGGFSMKLMIDGDRLTIGNVSDWTALIDGRLYSVKWDAAFVSVKTDLANGAVFILDEAGIPTDVITVSRDGTSILPNDVAIEVVNGKWKLPKAGKVVLTKDKSDLDVGKFKANGETNPNPSGLKLGYTAKSGTFKGSFALYQDASKGTPKLKKVSVTVNGTVVDDGKGGVGYGSAVIKKTRSMPVTIRK